MCPHIVPVRSDQRMCIVLYALLAKIRSGWLESVARLSANMLHACSSVKWSVGRNDAWLCWPCHCSSNVACSVCFLTRLKGHGCLALNDVLKLEVLAYEMIMPGKITPSVRAPAHTTITCAAMLFYAFTTRLCLVVFKSRKSKTVDRTKMTLRRKIS